MMGLALRRKTMAPAKRKPATMVITPRVYTTLMVTWWW
jgi:hypothetical protein